MACELRVRICVELLLNFECYKNHHQFRDFIRVSPDLEEARRMCAVDLEYSSFFLMQVLTSVIGRKIVSVHISSHEWFAGQLSKYIKHLSCQDFLHLEEKMKESTSYGKMDLDTRPL